MHILYLHQHFSTRDGFTSTRSYETARRLAARGHRITLICGRSEEAVLPEALNGRRVVELEGFELVVLDVGYGHRQSFGERVRAFRRFMWRASGEVMRRPRSDVVLCSSTPLTVGLPGLLSRLRGIPFVFEVRDIWPQAAVSVGALQNRLLIRCLEAFERLLYRGAARIVPISRGLAANIASKGIPGEKIAVVPHAADRDLFGSVPPPPRRDAEESLELLYTGALGPVNDLTTVLLALARLRALPVRLTIAGDGRRRGELEAMAQRLRISGQLRWLGSLPRRTLPELYADCHAGLVTVRPGPYFEKVTCPNKLFDIVAAGRGVISTAGSEVAALLERHGCGLSIRPGAVEALAANIRRWVERPRECESAGEAAASMAEAFDRGRMVSRLEQVLREAAFEPY